jgi:hypothetical protein
MDLTELKRLLREQKVTFKGAKKRYNVGDDDEPKILDVAHEWGKGASPRHAETLAHSAYWELYDERK